MKIKTATSIALILMTSGISTYAFAQSPAQPVKTNTYVYCELSVVTKALSKSVQVLADFGSKSNGHDSQILKDENTVENRDFVSMVEALNFMSEKGWEVVTAYATINSTCTYLLRKLKESDQ